MFSSTLCVGKQQSAAHFLTAVVPATALLEQMEEFEHQCFSVSCHEVRQASRFFSEHGWLLELGKRFEIYNIYIIFIKISQCLLYCFDEMDYWN